ncbi:hypothetical protein NP233_g6122 [Leucocoprinus birnbaumii]|uniref:Transmembrane protein n=1 Tax=Leucocoprinus birnbaumii TaxID=56174 RepID=A0AAD5YR84_9AGAR|nr:hypothetical protein NP233_g6122 [Leucocoprinus birnbaumii]
MVVPSDIHSLHNNESFPMALFKNITFDDTEDIFAYSVIEPEIWTNYNPTSPELYYNHTLHWLLFNQTQGESLGSIEFTFPQPARTVYYYGALPSPQFSICIDDCMSSNVTTVLGNPSGSGSALLHVIQFDGPEIHKVTLSGSTQLFGTNFANFSLDRIDLEVADNTVPLTTSSSSTIFNSPPSSSLSTTPQSTTSSSHVPPGLAPTLGGILGGLTFFGTCVLVICILIHRRRQIRENRQRSTLQPFSSTSPSSESPTSTLAPKFTTPRPRLTAIISSGKRVICSVVPLLPQSRDTAGRRFAVDAGPAADVVESETGGHQMPPQYEQVFGALGAGGDLELERDAGTWGSGRKALS